MVLDILVPFIKENNVRDTQQFQVNVLSAQNIEPSLIIGFQENT